MSIMCEECKCSIHLENQPDGSREYGGCDNGCQCCNRETNNKLPIALTIEENLKRWQEYAGELESRLEVAGADYSDIESNYFPEYSKEENN